MERPPPPRRRRVAPPHPARVQPAGWRRVLVHEPLVVVLRRRRRVRAGGGARGGLPGRVGRAVAVHLRKRESRIVSSSNQNGFNLSFARILTVGLPGNKTGVSQQVWLWGAHSHCLVDVRHPGHGDGLPICGRADRPRRRIAFREDHLCGGAVGVAPGLRRLAVVRPCGTSGV